MLIGGQYFPKLLSFINRGRAYTGNWNFFKCILGNKPANYTTGKKGNGKVRPRTGLEGPEVE